MKFSSATLYTLALSLFLNGSDAFTSPSIHQVQKTSSTQLYIIGPMIRKMREEQAKKKMPMASDEEREGEAPGLRVGTGAWRWPPVWPYSEAEFTPKEDIEEPKNASPVTGLLAGNLPNPEEAEEEKKEKLDIMKYWQEDKADVKTEMDAAAIAKLKEHYSFYLKDGMSVLELGAAEESYLPDGLQLERHVGVGANQKLMDQNSALTESFSANLNDVIEERGVNSEEMKALGSDQFDAIIMANTVDFLTNPREVFRSAWYLLKPGGVMMVPFTNREAFKSKFERAQTKMWRDMNDDQHMWICGSFFQFSASDGWENLKGFDCSPEGAKSVDDNGLFSNLSGGKSMNIFVVQATKAFVDQEINEADPEKSFSSKMWLLPTLEERDKQLLAPRLTRAFKTFTTDEQKVRVGENIEVLPKIYESLVKMDQFAFTFGMQAQLATDLITDPGYNGNDEQILALKMGLGLRTPSPDFWALVGQRTAAMVPEDKVNLLAHIIPRFGSDNPEQEEALQAFVAGLVPTFDVVRSKCPSMSEADVQLVGTELLAAEILQPGRSTKKEFALWVSSLTEEELTEMVATRKSYKEKAAAEMNQFQDERQAEQERIEEKRREMIEQQKKAREERSMVFNPQTGKMEPVEQKKK